MTVGVPKQIAIDTDPVDATDREAILAAVKWTSSDDKIATVAEDGTVTAIAAGKVTIKAESGELIAETEVTIAADA